MSARITALSALIACRKQGAWADRILKEYIVRDKLDRRDAAFASRLCYGVLQNEMLLDFYIQSYLHGPIKKLQPVVLDILRIAVYQILFMERVPISAAVNEAVNTGKKYANSKAAGLINGVLRSIVREKDCLPVPPTLSVRYSHPEPLVKLLEQNVGIELLEPLLQSHNSIPEIVIQRNPLAKTIECVDKSLELEEHPWLPDAYYLRNKGNVEYLPQFQAGLFLIQDTAARLAVYAAEPIPGMQVLDACAAPGGKSFATAFAMKNQGRIISCDIHPHKIQLIHRGAERLHISILEPCLQDGRENVPEWNSAMDIVIADVPCSGLGVIRKKPDIRYKELGKIEKLPEVQRALLDNLSCYVKPDGILLYSTCTILKRENEEVVQSFLDFHRDFFPEPFKLPGGLEAPSGMLTLLPCIHDTDGFFICKLRRNK